MKRILTIACLFSGACLHAQVVEVSGETYRANPSGYEPLPNVSIVVSRDNNVVLSSKSDANGRFTLKVRAGTPFIVVFYGDQRMPELDQLAGKEGIQDNVHVTLLTPTQYKRQLGGRVSLADKVKCDQARVSPEAKQFYQYVSTLKLE